VNSFKNRLDIFCADQEANITGNRDSLGSSGFWIVITISIGYHGDEEGVHYGYSDIAEAVNWLLNKDTEAADVIASEREFCDSSWCK